MLQTDQTITGSINFKMFIHFPKKKSFSQIETNMLQILSAVAAATYGAAVGVSPYAIGLDKGSYPG